VVGNPGGTYELSCICQLKEPLHLLFILAAKALRDVTPEEQSVPVYSCMMYPFFERLFLKFQEDGKCQKEVLFIVTYHHQIS